MARRIVPINDWAPLQEAMYDEPFADANTLREHDPPSRRLPPQSKFRAMSLSLPWRQRPRSSVMAWDDGVSDSLHDLALKPSKTHANSVDLRRGSLSKPEPSVKGMFRRASVSIKGMVHRRPPLAFANGERPEDLAVNSNNKDNTHSNTHLSRPSFASHQSRPSTSHSAWHRLRQAASFRHSRVLYSGAGEHDFSEPNSPALPVPGSGEQPPIIPRNTGAAAKAAASLHNEYFGFATTPAGSALLQQKHWLSPDDGQNDRESGIGIALTLSETPEPVTESGASQEAEDLDSMRGISRIDFISQLPPELAIQILSHLDAAALATASRVSRRWHATVANQHIWRESFLRERTSTYATSRPVQPGMGLGVPAVSPRNNWKEIYRVKDELDRRWKEGKARPVYLNGHSDSIYCLQFDETKIITGSRDKTIRIWDMHTFSCRLIIGPPEVVNDKSLLYDSNNNPTHYATLPDSEPLPDGQVRGRAYASVPTVASFMMHHKASILCLQYDDRILVTGSSDASCIVYSIRSGYRPIRRLQHHSAAVLDLVFDDKHIVTCSKDISICVWDRATGTLLKQLRGHQGPVNAVQMRGNTIVSCSGDFRVKLWNIDTGKNIREFQGHTKGLACSQFSEDGRVVASAGNDKVIRVWDANTGECVREMRAHDNLVRSLHIDSVSGRLVSGSYDTDIKVFDMETGRQLLDFPRWHSSWVLSAKSDYRRIISTGQDPKILIMDFGAGVKGVEMLESRAAGDGTESVVGGYI